jgi:GntR family transcriptional regulator/MocR family aminotransferase
MRRQHRRRRDAMIDALRRWLPEARIHGAAAGLHLTITLDGADRTTRSLDDVVLAATALEHGVKVHPLSWHRQRPGPPGLVLGYAARTPTEIAEAVETLGELAAEMQSGPCPSPRVRSSNTALN